MNHVKKMVRVANPILLVFANEAIAGNDAVAQARLFGESVPIRGAIPEDGCGWERQKRKSSTKSIFEKSAHCFVLYKKTKNAKNLEGGKDL